MDFSEKLGMVESESFEMNHLKNIVFDVGMVLVDFCWQEHCRNLGFDEAVINSFEDKIVLSECWNALDEGVITEQQAIERFVKDLPQYEAQIRKFWDTKEGFVKEYPYANPMILKLKELGYKVYLLSNYPLEMYKVHWPKFSFFDKVDGYIVSAQECIRKPDKAIYELLCSRYQLNAEECLFVDDRMDNVDAAKSVGMQAVLFDGYEQLKEYLAI